MKVKSLLIIFALIILGSFFQNRQVLAQTVKATKTPVSSPSPLPTVTPIATPKPDITEKTVENLGYLERLLGEQKIDSVLPLNPVKWAIRESVKSGVPANTIVLILLLPVISFVIAASRNIVGIRGFGIFMPAALSVVFVATGPILGIVLFVVIALVSTLVRMTLRKYKIKLQYLPRMSLILWFVSVSILGILFLAPIIKRPELAKVSIFGVLILSLLVEDFIKVQLGKSVKTALNLTTETLVLALISYIFLTLRPLQEYVLLHPEMVLTFTFILNYLLGKYSGLRFMELVRFRKLLKI